MFKQLLRRLRLRHKKRRGSLAALPWKDVWRDACGNGAHFPSAA